MKAAVNFVARTLLRGAVILVPIYLAILLLIKLAESLLAVVHPISSYLPEAIPAERLLSFLLVLLVCFVVGLAVRSRIGRSVWERLEKGLFQRIPAYALFRNLTQRGVGGAAGSAWQPALVEIEDALVPAFIIEEIGDGQLTVFVPSVPTPLAGAVYVLPRERVHAVDVTFAQAIKTISSWGSGSKELVAAMKAGRPAKE